MKKVLDFLENYVQWIAIGLGVLFVGYTVYAYAIQQPVMVTGVGQSPTLLGTTPPCMIALTAAWARSSCFFSVCGLALTWWNRRLPFVVNCLRGPAGRRVPRQRLPGDDRAGSASRGLPRGRPGSRERWPRGWRRS